MINAPGNKDAPLQAAWKRHNGNNHADAILWRYFCAGWEAAKKEEEVVNALDGTVEITEET